MTENIWNLREINEELNPKPKIPEQTNKIFKLWSDGVLDLANVTYFRLRRGYNCIELTACDAEGYSPGGYIAEIEPTGKLHLYSSINRKYGLKLDDRRQIIIVNNSGTCENGEADCDSNKKFQLWSEGVPDLSDVTYFKLIESCGDITLKMVYFDGTPFNCPNVFDIIEDGALILAGGINPTRGLKLDSYGKIILSNTTVTYDRDVQ